ncbi:unnamed protein product [Notodromas monacha]|uniref:START domain-containing protein n=1 Tax=Notodromas monacha TaxID=399045 RepID=A0A7R9BUU5_9CRUS|nr:unnamed protein product [Notodromas monacha]CAG0921200.1 unnamed protein product [Notodromas monacha]
MGILVHVLLQAMAVMTNLTQMDPKFEPLLGSLSKNSIPLEIQKPVVIPDASSTSAPVSDDAGRNPKAVPQLTGDLAQYQSYIQQGQETLAEIKELMNRDGWKTSRKDKVGTIVKYLFHPKYNRRIFMTTAVFPAPPEILYRVIWTEGGEMHKWNPKIEDVEILQPIGDIAQISRQVAANEAGGIVTQRDFVVLNERDEEDGPLGKIYYVAYVSTEWPGRPPLEDFVRAENGPSGFRFEPIEGNPDATKVTWIFNADLKFDHLPATMLNAVLPASTLNYMSSLRKHLEEMKSKGEF